jgi:hypothetical protein
LINMTALDTFSVVTGVIGVYTVLVSLCRWLSPLRRLRALEETMQRVKLLLATIITQEEGLLMQDAHEYLYR